MDWRIKKAMEDRERRMLIDGKEDKKAMEEREENVN